MHTFLLSSIFIFGPVTFHFRAMETACGFTIVSSGGTNIQFSMQIYDITGIIVYEGSGKSYR